MANKQKKFRLEDGDYELIEKFKKAFEKKGIRLSDSDVVSFALRNLKTEGSITVYLNSSNAK